MIFEPTPLSGLYVIKPKRFTDKRGYFMETYNQVEFNRVVGNVDFIQDNESESVFGVLRGLHMQKGSYAQAKLVRVAHGVVYDVAVDLREGSETFGQWFGTELSHQNGEMMFIPRGFAHGFVVLSEVARFIYKVDNVYAPNEEVTIWYDDPQLSIQWPRLEDGYVLSSKDADCAISLRDYSEQLRRRN